MDSFESRFAISAQTIKYSDMNPGYIRILNSGILRIPAGPALRFAREKLGSLAISLNTDDVLKIQEYIFHITPT
jgi:hypothetical protein